MMAGIRSKDTQPEMLVRRGLHQRGFRFRLHDWSLPGCPDLVLPRYHAVIFVHGCFWHGHDCSFFRWPRSREKFWREKIAGNRKRDNRVIELLQEAGWRVLTIWECAFRGKPDADRDAVLNRVTDWIASTKMEETLTGEPHGHC
jgi:DNA mismatch endonuclease (patch repair protein)